MIKQDMPQKPKQKKAVMIIQISDKVDFKANSFIQEKQGWFIIVK